MGTSLVLKLRHDHDLRHGSRRSRERKPQTVAFVQVEYGLRADSQNRRLNGVGSSLQIEPIGEQISAASRRSGADELFDLESHRTSVASCRAVYFSGTHENTLIRRDEKHTVVA